MGEQYFCPKCDHVDLTAGECPECGETLTKLELENSDASPNTMQGEEFDFVPSETAGYDDFEDSDFEEERLQPTAY